jgi:tetratricopeptide (TPR) repeat protein
VGVRQYDKVELRNLDYTENDVTVLAKMLRAAGYRRVVLMTQTHGAAQARYLPTAANIRRELRGLLEDRRPEDTVIVAFCGHGLQFKGSDEYSRRGEPDKAVPEFNEAIKLNPRYTAAYFNRGLAHARRKDHDRAIEDFAAAIRLDPRDPLPYSHRGWAYFNKAPAKARPSVV